MRRSALTLLGVLLVLGLVSRAHADDEPTSKPSYRVVVDRVEHEPASIGGTRLQITMSALSLQGGQIDLTDPKETKIKTTVSGSEIKAPYALGSFDTGDIEYQVADIVGGWDDASFVGVTDYRGMYYSSGTTA